MFRQLISSIDFVCLCLFMMYSMEVKASRRFTYQRERSLFNPVNERAGGRVGGGWPTKKVLCVYFLEGRCNRNPCRFAHTESQTLPVSNHKKSPPSYNCPKNNVRVSSGSEEGTTHVQNRENPDRTVPNKSSLDCSTGSDDSGSKRTLERTTPKNVCYHWLSGNCVKGDECRFWHSWFCGEGFTMLAKLEGHKKAVSGIALPLRSDKLYSGSRDGTVQLWDCHTGQSASVINLGAEVGSLICEGPWVFVGMPNVVKAWHIESSAEFSLDGPVGEVYSMVVANEMLFAGAQDGNILVWKGIPNTQNPFQLAALLKGHTRPVTCLAVGGKRLYSGSMDNTIRVWDLDTLEAVMTLNGHTDAPMSLLCWDQYLLSCSLDNTIKVWIMTEEGNLEVAYTHNEDHGVLALGGLNDPDGNPVLICSCNDDSVHLYELPS
ncbi:hypothetical protein CISIN_1g011711mg [Citrus sinensis]|nr:hypothetical protein CISIN_1g011711mg [Citrus sinensis]